MKKFICLLLIGLMSSNSIFAKSVKENENEKAETMMTLFNNGCITAFKSKKTFDDFLLNNDVQILDDSNFPKKYFISQNKIKYDLTVNKSECSISIKNINKDIFNNKFSIVRDEFLKINLTEYVSIREVNNKKTFYISSSFNYEGKQKLPVQIIIDQTNDENVDFQTKITFKKLNDDSKIHEDEDY